MLQTMFLANRSQSCLRKFGKISRTRAKVFKNGRVILIRVKMLLLEVIEDQAFKMEVVFEAMRVKTYRWSKLDRHWIRWSLVVRLTQP